MGLIFSVTMSVNFWTFNTVYRWTLWGGSNSKDCKTIAMLVKDGRYREVYIPDDIYQELREVVAERERLQEQLTSIHNRVVRWLDIRFPEFQKVFKDWRRNAALITLRSFPTPGKDRRSRCQ